MKANKSGVVRDIAKERIDLLYNLAKSEYTSDPELSRRYIRIMREIGRHYKITLPKEIKRGICRKCNTILIPGKSASVRLASGKRYIVYKCQNCKSEMHIHY